MPTCSLGYFGGWSSMQELRYPFHPIICKDSLYYWSLSSLQKLFLSGWQCSIYNVLTMAHEVLLVIPCHRFEEIVVRCVHMCSIIQPALLLVLATPVSISYDILSWKCCSLRHHYSLMMNFICTEAGSEQDTGDVVEVEVSLFSQFFARPGGTIQYLWTRYSSRCFFSQ